MAELRQVVGKPVFDLYFKPETVNRFIDSVELSRVRDAESFETSEIELARQQLDQLYDYMEYDPEADGFEADEDFYINLFKNGDRGRRVREIIGDENFARVEPLIEFKLTFTRSEYLENLDELETESPLDSFIKDWLNRG